MGRPPRPTPAAYPFATIKGGGATIEVYLLLINATEVAWTDRDGRSRSRWDGTREGIRLVATELPAGGATLYIDNVARGGIGPFEYKLKQVNQPIVIPQFTGVGMAYSLVV